MNAGKQRAVVPALAAKAGGRPPVRGVIVAAGVQLAERAETTDQLVAAGLAAVAAAA
jgi:hypothetical protein